MSPRSGQRALPRAGASYVMLGAGLAGACLVGCVAELPEAPAPPVVFAPPSITNQPVALFRGLKQASTAIVLSTGEALVPLDEATTWSAQVQLRAGTNAFSIGTADALDRHSTYVPISVVLDDVPPEQPVLDPVAPTTLQDELRVVGTKGLGDRLVVNGSVRPTGSLDNADFALELPLVPGSNLVRVAALDLAGNESDVLDVPVERVDAVPFTVTAPPAVVADAALLISGTRGAGVEVLLDGVVVVAADAAGAWSHLVTLAPGANRLELSGRIALEPTSEADVDVDVFFDAAAATVTIAAPAAGAFVDVPLVDIAGTVVDEGAVVVEVCIGACALDTDFAPATLTGNAFAASVDLSARADLPDGAFADVVVRATDATGRRSSTSVSVLIGRAPVELAGAAALALAAGAPYVEARAFLDGAGAAWVQLDADGPPWLTDLERVSDASAVAAFAPRVAALPGGAAAVLLEDSPAASATAGEAGLVYAEVTPAGATRVVVVQGDVGSAIGSADVTLAPGGSMIAFSRADEVLFVAESSGGMAFDAAVAVSDATTRSPAQVRLARLDGGALIVAWQETSDRDGTLDDVEVVARVIDDDGAPLGPVLQLSAAGAPSTMPELAALDDDTVLVGWLEAGGVRIGAADASTLIGGTPPTTNDATAGVTGSGAASDFSIAADGSRLAVCWLDDGAALVGGATPGLVVRSSTTGPGGLGAAAVLSTSAVSEGACDLAGAVLHASWISGGTIYLQPRFLP